MSVEASKWARLADVQKSSSKLVLMNLAQLVRYDAAQWTVFASIDYLVKVTHLNRKTVIEALARLRDLGAIKDTGRRAGDNRSSIIYRLCPNAVPLVDLATAATVAGALVQPMPQHDLDLANEDEADEESAFAGSTGATDVCAYPCDEPYAAEQTPDHAGLCLDGEVAIAQQTITSSESLISGPPRNEIPPVRHRQRPIQGASGSMETRAASGKRSSVPPHAGAGAGPTRLPAAWKLPDRWRIWTQRERPLWAAEKIDAMEATFSAYMRSRPGQHGLSADWFESWRLWVFRERDGKASDKPWHGTWSGIVAKGEALGLERAPNEPEVNFKARVFQAAGHMSPH